MTFDIVIVSYHSERWLPGCIAVLAAARFDLQRLHITVVDNASGTECVQALRRLAAAYPQFGSFRLIENAKNEGFGRACNRGAKAGSAPWLFFLNPDCEVAPDLFSQLERGIARHAEAGGFECRQLPYEQSHHVDPCTLHTPWASGAAMVVARRVFDAVGGFDKHLFMYCEDVDLSWRIRAAGHPLVFLPQAVVVHHVLHREDDAASERREYVCTALGRLLLSYKYGVAWHGNRRYLATLRHPRHFEGVRRLLLKNYLKHFVQLWPFWLWRWGHRRAFRVAEPQLALEGFAPERGRAVLEKRVTNGPRISVVIRTHRRPAVLRGALQSLANQTYAPHEVIVVEDGEATSGEVVAEFATLPICYHATGQNVGRGRAGNLGLEMASGEYLNFLDDDDAFYPDHLELMAERAMAHPEADLILGRAMVMQVEVESHEPYRYTVKDLQLFRFDRIDLFTMCQTCQVPIQTGLFKKSLFEACGGLAEHHDGYEDWAMWLRFLKRAVRIDPIHVDIHRATSVFLIPAGRRDATERASYYHDGYEALVGDDAFRFEVSLAEMRQFYDGFVADMAAVRNAGLDKLDEYLRYQARRDEDRHS
ncbi:MAG: glycosyltransferase [Oscillospiraceae bacterium]